MTIRTHTADGVATIEIARPEKKNALTVAMYQQMADAIGAAHDDTTVRAILIHGQPDIFTAGNDLEDFMKNPPADEKAPVTARRWASAPRCCCIATSLTAPTTRCSRCLSSASACAANSPPACWCR